MLWIAAQESEKEAAIAENASQNESTTEKALAETTTLPKEEKIKEVKLPKTEEERKLDREAAVSYKWGVSPYISSLNYGSLSRGSSIDNRLEGNPREALGTTGYGMKIEFALSKNSSFRAGIGFAPLQYQTDNFQVNIINDVVNIFQLAGISPEQASQGAISTSPEALAFFNENTVVSIVQDISYVEFPLDYQYRFINHRVGLSLNTGLGILVLNDNTVSAIANDGRSLEVGRETTLRGLSLSLNLGLSGFYNMTDKWRFNVEPIFTYQLNPYTTSIGNFQTLLFRCAVWNYI